MKILKKIILVAIIASVAVVSAKEAMASLVTVNNWSYTADANNDASGSTVFEMHGLAVKENSTSYIFAINGNMPIDGTPWDGPADGRIGWGDLVINGSGLNLAAASNAGVLYGVKFGLNNSGASQTGFYKDVSLKSDSLENSGYNSLKQYYDYGFYRENTFGTDFPTLEAAYTYLYGADVAQNPNYGNTPMLNVINSGNKVGDITLMSQNDLIAEQLDFNVIYANGSQTIGFKFPKSFLSNGSYDISLFYECGNDGMGMIKGQGAMAAPEMPNSPYVLLFIGGMGVIVLKKKIMIERAN